jgi:two-component system, OmpR family, sensor histidine kinase VicK
MLDYPQPSDVRVLRDRETRETFFKILSEANESIEIVVEAGFSISLGYEEILQKIRDRKNPLVKARLISTLTAENLSIIGDVRQIEPRHLDHVQGNFAIFDRKNYFAFLSDSINTQTRILHISNDSFLKTQEYLFDSLWSEALTIRERTKELGLQVPEFTKTIADPSQISELINRLVLSARSELLVLCSTSNAFIALGESGILDLCQKANLRGVDVKILVHTQTNEVKDFIKSLLKEKFRRLSVQFMRKALQTRIVTIIVDKAEFAAIQINEGSSQNFQKLLKACTYSNNELNLTSAISLLQSLWIQSELDNQNVIKQVYFQMFKGFKLQDETYKRDWSFEKKTD